MMDPWDASKIGGKVKQKELRFASCSPGPGTSCIDRGVTTEALNAVL